MATKNIEEWRRLRRLRPCPACGAGVGKPCIGKKGTARKSLHRERCRTEADDLAVAFINSYLEKHPVPDQSGYVLYGIFDPISGKFVYVGQTGNLGKRARQHLKSGLKPHRFPPVKKWLHEQFQAGNYPTFQVLQSCSNQAASLRAETEWVHALAKGGHNLLNNWKIHRTHNAITEG